MEIGYLPLGEPGVFRSLLLPEAADALAQGEPLTALGLTEDGLALGAAAGYLENGRFLLRSLYVAPDHRRKGGGRMLVEALEGLAGQFASGMEIRFTATREEHFTLPPFLRALGFEQEPDDGENIYLTTLKDAAKSPFFSGEGKDFGTPLADLRDRALSLLEKAALAAEAPLPEGGLGSERVDREISLCSFEGSTPQAFVILETVQPDTLALSAAWSAAKNPTVLPRLLRTAMALAQKNYPLETGLTVQPIGAVSAALVRTILPDAVPISQVWVRDLNT